MSKHLLILILLLFYGMPLGAAQVTLTSKDHPKCIVVNQKGALPIYVAPSSAQKVAKGKPTLIQVYDCTYRECIAGLAGKLGHSLLAQVYKDSLDSDVVVSRQGGSFKFNGTSMVTRCLGVMPYLDGLKCVAQCSSGRGLQKIAGIQVCSLCPESQVSKGNSCVCPADKPLLQGITCVTHCADDEMAQNVSGGKKICIPKRSSP